MSNFLASSVLNAGSYTPENLLAGESDVITKPDLVGGSASHPALTVLGRIGVSGILIPSVRTANDGSQNPVAILVEAADATLGNVTVPVYVAGEFLIDGLVWDASWATDAQKLAAFGDKAAIVAKKSGFSG